MRRTDAPFGLRMPPDIKAWIKNEAARNRASQNGEIVRILARAMSEQQAASAAVQSVAKQTA